MVVLDTSLIRLAVEVEPPICSYNPSNYDDFGRCLTGGNEVHDVVIERIIDLSKAFLVYDDEVLAKKRELLQFAQDAFSGLKVDADILRIDSEVSEIHENLKRIEHQELTVESNGSYLDATSDATLEVIKESVSPIRLCYRPGVTSN